MTPEEWDELDRQVEQHNDAARDVFGVYFAAILGTFLIAASLVAAGFEMIAAAGASAPGGRFDRGRWEVVELDGRRCVVTFNSYGPTGVDCE